MKSGWVWGKVSREEGDSGTSLGLGGRDVRAEVRVVRDAVDSDTTSEPWVRSQEIQVYLWWVMSPFWTLVHPSASWAGWTRWFQLSPALWLEGVYLGKEATFEVTSATWSHGRDDVMYLTSRYTSPSSRQLRGCAMKFWACFASQLNAAILGSGVRRRPSGCEWEDSGSSYRQGRKILYRIQPTVATAAQEKKKKKRSSLKQFENNDMLSLDLFTVSMIFHQMAIRMTSWTTHWYLGMAHKRQSI